MSAPAHSDSAVLEQLRLHGTHASLTSGVSMQPLFKTHRDVVILSVPNRELKKYDVVLYPAPEGKFYLHRIVAVKENEFLIRGDNTYITEHVPKSAIVAVMTAFNRKGKHTDISAFGYRLYSRIWVFIYPVRRFFVRAKGALRRIGKKLFGK